MKKFVITDHVVAEMEKVRVEVATQAAKAREHFYDLRGKRDETSRLDRQYYLGLAHGYERATSEIATLIEEMR